MKKVIVFNKNEKSYSEPLEMNVLSGLTGREVDLFDPPNLKDTGY